MREKEAEPGDKRSTELKNFRSALNNTFLLHKQARLAKKCQRITVTSQSAVCAAVRECMCCH